MKFKYCSIFPLSAKPNKNDDRKRRIPLTHFAESGCLTLKRISVHGLFSSAENINPTERLVLIGKICQRDRDCPRSVADNEG